jgi:1-acyl-sn-glycerol-3-phosphate acyltransferase
VCSRSLFSRSSRRHLLQRLARGAVGIMARVQAKGQHHIPGGPCLIAPNHLGHADPVLVVSFLSEPPEIAALSDLRRALAAFAIYLYDPILVRRDQVDREVLTSALDALQRGKQLLVFPEARMSRSGALEKARLGVGYLAVEAGVPVVPVAITGTETVARSLLRLRRPALTITFAPPIVPAPDPSLPRRAQWEAVTTQIMQAIATHLPPSYRGVYANGHLQASAG